MKQILIETLPFKVERSFISESIRKNGGKLIVPNMIIQRADTPNKNQRIYPKPILEREMTKIMEGVRSAGSAGLIGELDHPDSSVVNLKNACIGILDWRWNGNDVLGDVEVLNTPSGNILKEILMAGYVPGISSRGMGSVKQLYENDNPDMVEVEDDFEMVTFDAVSDPSTHSALFRSMNESRIRRSESYPELPKYQKASVLITDIICNLSGACCFSK
jgi:hypothetical protein